MTIQEGRRAEASTWIDASPEDVWRIVANIESLGRYSTETSRTEWLPGSKRHQVGARFRGHNSNDRHEWHTDCAITELTEPIAFAFDVARQMKPAVSPPDGATPSPPKVGARGSLSHSSRQSSMTSRLR